jgi:hypothetical protein
MALDSREMAVNPSSQSDCNLRLRNREAVAANLEALNASKDIGKLIHSFLQQAFVENVLCNRYLETWGKHTRQGSAYLEVSF